MRSRVLSDRFKAMDIYTGEIVAMKKVGDAMSPALKETAEGGLAATPTARRLYEQVFGRPADGAGCTGCGGCGAGR